MVAKNSFPCSCYRKWSSYRILRINSSHWVRIRCSCLFRFDLKATRGHRFTACFLCGNRIRTYSKTCNLMGRCIYTKLSRTIPICLSCYIVTDLSHGQACTACWGQGNCWSCRYCQSSVYRKVRLGSTSTLFCFYFICTCRSNTTDSTISQYTSTCYRSIRSCSNGKGSTCRVHSIVAYLRCAKRSTTCSCYLRYCWSYWHWQGCIYRKVRL